ncbi:MAG TPA: hypothetical protein VF418_05250 [Sphingomonadaceae bacterium]
MRRPLALLTIALAALPLAGCVTDDYGSGYGYRDGYYDGGRYGRGYYGDRYGYDDGYYGSPYDVWYDGYYGPIEDGYWGGDGYFWYSSGRDWRRGDGNHFRRGAYGNYRHYRFDDRGRGRDNVGRGDERDWGRYNRGGDRSYDRDQGYRRGEGYHRGDR